MRFFVLVKRVSYSLFIWKKDNPVKSILFSKDVDVPTRGNCFIRGELIFSCKKWLIFNPLTANPTKWSNILKQFIGNSRRIFLSMFDHFEGLALKGLKGITQKLRPVQSNCFKRISLSADAISFFINRPEVIFLLYLVIVRYLI